VRPGRRHHADPPKCRTFASRRINNKPCNPHWGRISGTVGFLIHLDILEIFILPKNKQRQADGKTQLRKNQKFSNLNGLSHKSGVSGAVAL
jgi:hypothetical protein